MALKPSAITTLIENASSKSPREALAIEVLHNLQYQHQWSDLKLYTVTSPAYTSDKSTPTTSTDISKSLMRSKSPSRSTLYLVSGLPPRHMYIHPDMQKWMIKHDVHAEDVKVQREWVLPLSVGEKWSLKQFCWVFDGLSARHMIQLSTQGSMLDGSERGFEWTDAKRLILGMMAHNGMGGDGTISYYIMQEGEVKPRQNG